MAHRQTDPRDCIAEGAISGGPPQGGRYGSELVGILTVLDAKERKLSIRAQSLFSNTSKGKCSLEAFTIKYY